MRETNILIRFHLGKNQYDSESGIFVDIFSKSTFIIEKGLKILQLIRLCGRFSAISADISYHRELLERLFNEAQASLVT
jgi:hypothetical protein